jgi:uncharacterized integral membrane protein (TIGR00698 family)
VWFGRALYAVAGACCLSPWVSAPVALALGLILALSLANPFAAASRKLSKLLLQVSVVLLGFGMDLRVVLRAGTDGLLFAAGTILATFVLGRLLARRLSVHRETSTLISAGTAICGGSAIAAVGSVIGAAEGSMTVAMGAVFLLNAIALYAFPPLGHLLGLSPTQFGVWAGVAIHDVSSVVGAASTYGPVALQTATAVKLSRALWIIPVALACSWGLAPAGAQQGRPTRSRLPIPWFIGLFVLASVARSFVPLIASASPAITGVARTGLTLTLFLIGSGLSLPMLKKVGVRPLVQALALWLFLAAASLLVVRLTLV